MPPVWPVTCGVFLVGLVLGAIANWAIYTLAWNPRPISPWGPLPKGVDRRKPLDRLPVTGWFGLRREHAVHGSGFWLRPLAIELVFGFGLVALFWWEVDQRGLVVGQLSELLNRANVPFGVPPGLITQSALWQTFLSHCLLITLMAAASFIDIDEKIIPDEITIPGTLLGLLMATLLPMSLLPVATFPDPNRTPDFGVPVDLAQLAPNLLGFIEPLSISSPNPWPELFDGAPRWESLAIAQFCWWLWCFALTPRFFRGRRGVCRGLAILLRRVVRELMRGLLGLISWTGAAAIVLVWWWGGAHWMGLLTALVGLVGCGGLIWIVRIVGTAALGREAMGFGDVTLMMMVGTFIGWQSGIVAFFLSLFPGLVVGLVQLLVKSDDQIPYGPYLCLGTLYLLVRWADVWNRAELFFSVGWLVPAVLAVCMVLLGVMLMVWQFIKNRLFQR